MATDSPPSGPRYVRLFPPRLAGAFSLFARVDPISS
jgi:hypothetical protein